MDIFEFRMIGSILSIFQLGTSSNPSHSLAYTWLVMINSSKRLKLIKITLWAHSFWLTYLGRYTLHTATWASSIHAAYFCKNFTVGARLRQWGLTIHRLAKIQRFGCWFTGWKFKVPFRWNLSFFAEINFSWWAKGPGSGPFHCVLGFTLH